jgi:hypothetical protein
MEFGRERRKGEKERELRLVEGRFLSEDVVPSSMERVFGSARACDGSLLDVEG